MRFDGKPALVVALTGWRFEEWVPRLERAAPGRAIVAATSAEDPVPEPYYLFCWKPDPRLLKRTPAPRLILSAGAGVDHILDHGPPEGVPVTRIVDPDLTGRMVEYVVLHCLYHLRRMDEGARNQADAVWRSAAFAAAREVTVGLMGVGQMGKAAARGLISLGFDVVGWGRTPRQDVPFRSYAGPAALDAFLSQTNILVSLLPSTPETRGLIGRSIFARLRRGGAFGAPVFINAGRGDTVEEAELFAALSDGTLRAASLDVFAKEPLPPENPFWRLPNVVLTPHNAADSHPEAVVAAVVAEIGRFERGEVLLHAVDPVRGY